MNFLLQMLGVKFVMGEFMRDGEPLPVRMVERIYPDDPHPVADVGHAGELVCERRVLQDDAPSPYYPFDRNGRCANRKFRDDRARDGACFDDAHDFALAVATAAAIRSLIWALAFGLTASDNART